MLGFEGNGQSGAERRLERTLFKALEEQASHGNSIHYLVIVEQLPVRVRTMQLSRATTHPT